MVTFHQLASIVANAVVTRIKRSIIPDSEVWAAGSRTIRSFAGCRLEAAKVHSTG